MQIPHKLCMHSVNLFLWPFSAALTFTVFTTEVTCAVTHAGSCIQDRFILTHPTTCWYRDKRNIFENDHFKNYSQVDIYNNMYLQRL